MNSHVVKPEVEGWILHPFGWLPQEASLTELQGVELGGSELELGLPLDPGISDKVSQSLWAHEAPCILLANAASRTP